MAADLEQAGPWSGRGGLVEQQPALVLGQPTGHRVRQGPGELEVGRTRAGSGAGIVARQGVGAPRNRGYTHARHSTGSRGSVIATSEATVTRPPRPEQARQRWRARWRRSWSERSAAGWAVLATYAWLVAMAFLQRPGETTFDTKFDLTSDVGRFLVQSLSLWKQDSNFGELQNQAYGYLFPQGAFFLLGDDLGVPDWVVQRAWTALLLVVAFEGARRLWQALRPEASPWSAWVAGIAFATAPRLLGLVGVLSAGDPPDSRAALGRAADRARPARASRAASRCPVVGSGGALHRRRQRGGEPRCAAPAAVRGARPPSAARVAGAWCAGGWAPPPSPAPGGCCRCWCWVATARRSWTTSRRPRPWCAHSGWTNVARGADHWVSYVFVGGDPWWPGSYELSTDSAAHRGDRRRGRGRPVGADPDARCPCAGRCC